MGFIDFLVKFKAGEVENDPRFIELKNQHRKILESQQQLKEINPFASTPELTEYEKFQRYEKNIKPFLVLYNITGIIYAILFFCSFLFYCSYLKEALLITIGSFVISVGCIISPLWKISGALMLDEDYTDPLSIVRFSLSIFFFFFGIFLFSNSWLIIIPIVSLMSLIVIFILNRIYN